MKKIIAVILCVCMVWNIMEVDTLASSYSMDITMDETLDETNSVGEIGGFLASNIETTKRIQANKLFTTYQGHGFAAERANNLYDAYKGIKGTIVGDDFLANGPDRRIINRDGSITLVQDKYCRTASESVASAFDENGIYRYVDSDGKPMQLEVPKDQYDEAVELMREKIQQGKVKNVTDPEEAINIVRKGNVTYDQAVNIAKAGNVDSLIYDVANGTVFTATALGITFVMDYAICRMNGYSQEVALQSAITNGLKTGSVVMATFVISSQLARTGAVHAFAPTAEALAKSLGVDTCEAILEKIGVETVGLTATGITAKTAEILSKELLAEGVMVIVLTAIDVSDLIRGRISKEELLKNLTVTIVATAAGVVGGYVGGTVGTFILPGAGSVVGAIAGNVVAGGTAALVSELVADKIYKSDADEMYEIICDEFQILAENYLINEAEGESIVLSLSERLVGDTLKEMYASEDRSSFAVSLLEPLFVEQISARENIILPTEEDIRLEYKMMMKGIVFIH